MKTSPPVLTPHRFARLLAWVKLLLAWTAWFIAAGEAAAIGGRVRARFMPLDRLARMVRDLIAIRAGAMVRRAGSSAPRDYAPPGFIRRMRPRQLVRAGVGSRVRRLLRHRNPARRVAMLIEALRNLDTLARRAARRLPAGLTRLRPLIIRRPQCDAARTLFAPEPAVADSS